MKMDYRAIGLKVGLEIHQQLETEKKLFCSCKNTLEEEVIGEFMKKLRPTKSELGMYDPAALMEFSRDRTYIYQIVPNASCLVEMDEEPPHPINREAVEIAIACALLLNSRIVDEVHVMRKEVIDGSNTSGFQRTAIISIGGYIMDGEEKIGIQTITLEEDSCRKIKEDSRTVVYRLDRQGIPLIEIATEPVIRDPEQARRVAYKIGTLIYSTGKARRALGTIRQDINLSIENGAKTEIKGIQELSMIPKVIEYEVQRQLRLLELREILRSKVPRPEKKYFIVNEIFANTSSKLIRRYLNESIILVPLKKMKGLLGFELQPNRRFASELADYVRVWTKLEGLLHSDELPGYGISEAEVKALYKNLNPDEDAFIILMGSLDECLKALEVVIDRINLAFERVPEETRNAMPDGTTRFARTRPGSARMYVETDIPPFVIEEGLIEKVKSNLPRTIEDRIQLLQKKYNLSAQLAKELVDGQMEGLFEEIVSIGIKPTIVASTLTQTVKYLRRSGVEVDKLTKKHIMEIFLALKESKIAKEAVETIISEWAKDPSLKLDSLIDKLGLRLLSKEEAEKIIDALINENIENIKTNKDKAFDLLMKIAMSRLRGKVDSSLVVEIIKTKMRSIIE